jgi:hypothetical protein
LFHSRGFFYPEDGYGPPKRRFILQDIHGATSQKTAFFIVTAVKTSNPTKVGNTEFTPQALWPIAKSILKREEPSAPTDIHGSSGLKFHPFEKAGAIADYLEIQFTPLDLCDENHKRRMEARVQALLEAVDNRG